MSFTPLASGGLSSALGGIVEPTKFIITNSVGTSDSLEDVRVRDYSERRIHSPSEKKASNNTYTILIVVMSAIIFVTVIGIYDVIRGGINNYFADIALTDPNSHNSPDDIERTNIANTNALWASMVFAGVAIILAIIFIAFILLYLNSRDS